MENNSIESLFSDKELLLTILSFYGYKLDCKALCSSLNSEIREKWNEIKDLEGGRLIRSILKIDKNFTKKYLEFVLQNKLYEDVCLSLYLENKNAYKTFISLLQQVQNVNRMKFNEIWMIYNAND